MKKSTTRYPSIFEFSDGTDNFDFVYSISRDSNDFYMIDVAWTDMFLSGTAGQELTMVGLDDVTPFDGTVAKAQSLYVIKMCNTHPTNNCGNAHTDTVRLQLAYDTTTYVMKMVSID